MGELKRIRIHMFVFLFVLWEIAVGRGWMNLRAYEVCEGIHSQLVVGILR